MTAPIRLSSALQLRFTGRVADLDRASRRLLLDRVTAGDELIQAQTTAIIRAVREDGDVALRRFALEFDGAEVATLAVDMDICRDALSRLEPALRQAMERARDNIATVHRAFHPTSQETETEPGVLIGRRPDPLASAGVYAPGGRAAYPSSLLMGAVAARIAGVRRVVVCSPPGANGLPSPAVLAAAALAEVDEVFAIGGAGAIAAMAYGTATVQPVDVIVGPGNAYVTEAKQQVARWVATDTPAGPSELLVIADTHADPAVVAREVLAQAEHDPRAAVIVICLGQAVATAIADEIIDLLPSQQRRAIIQESLMRNGGILLADSYDEAVELSGSYAPEHVLLAIGEDRQAGVLARLRNAGTVFLGQHSSVAFGDYMTGANHVLPTGGLARLRSGLSPFDFVRWTTYQRVSAHAAASLAPAVAVFADAEGLPAHADAARQWLAS